MTASCTTADVRSVPFEPAEYGARLTKVCNAMTDLGFDAILVTEPANICYLTGYDAWSYYVPQMLVVPNGADPFFIVREQDATAVLWGTHLEEQRVYGYPETYLTGIDSPTTFFASTLAENHLASANLAVESTGTCLTPQALDELRAALPHATLRDSRRLIDWARLVKTDAEVAVIREAARLSDYAMATAFDMIRPGIREVDVAARIYEALIAGTGGITGTCPLRPCMMRGERTNAPHVSWSEGCYQPDEPVVIELGGHRHNYAAGLTRTAYLGDPPQKYRELDAAVQDGRLAALDMLRAGNTAEHVDSAWRAATNPRGVYKTARIGYSIGLSFPTSTWVEPTISLAPGDATVLQPNMAIHLMLEVQQGNVGHGLSEVVVITDGEPELLSRQPRELRVI